jgi:hypothetical protein
VKSPAVVKWMVRQHIILAPVKTMSTGAPAGTTVTESKGSESMATCWAGPSATRVP